MSYFKRLLFVFIVFSGSVHAQGGDEFDQQVKALSEEEKTDLIMGTGDPIELYNFTSGEKETIYRVDKISSDKFEEFLPPLPEVKAMYQLYVSHGLTPYEAYAQSMTHLIELLLSK